MSSSLFAALNHGAAGVARGLRAAVSGPKNRTKTSIVAFGNCQADAIIRLLSVSLPKDRYAFSFYWNNWRTGEMASTDAILAAVAAADVLLYQPLGVHHGPLSEQNVLNVRRKDGVTLSWAFLYNDASCSLSHEVSHPTHKYGFVFGEKAVLEHLRRDGIARTLDAFRDGGIDFGLPERFRCCVDEIARREQATTVKLADFIRANYRERKLFLSHSHPTTAVFLEMLRQIKDQAGLPIDLRAIDAANENVAMMHDVAVAFTPYDVAVHGYKFPHRPDWYEKGVGLIHLIDHWRRIEEREAAEAAAKAA